MADGVMHIAFVLNASPPWRGIVLNINYRKSGWVTSNSISWHRQLRRTLVLHIFIASINEQAIRK
jgi:hypothetical protein